MALLSVIRSQQVEVKGKTAEGDTRAADMEPNCGGDDAQPALDARVTQDDAAVASAETEDKRT